MNQQSWTCSQCGTSLINCGCENCKHIGFSIYCPNCKIHPGELHKK